MITIFPDLSDLAWTKEEKICPYENLIYCTPFTTEDEKIMYKEYLESIAKEGSRI